MLQNELRIGRITSAIPSEGLRKPSFILEIDLGPELGMRRSSAQLTERYRPEDLVDRFVVCVCDLEPKQIGPYLSEVLVLGTESAESGGGITLLRPDSGAQPGAIVH